VVKKTRIVRCWTLCILAMSLVLITAWYANSFAQQPPPSTTMTCNDTAGQSLSPGSGSATTDLNVIGPCEVKAGTYTFRNVNIYSSGGSNGSLNFDDAKIDFFAENIVIENNGSLIAGSPSAPIGTNGGVVTIHLWGAQTDAGVTCKTDAHCGVPSSPPNDIWDSNPRTMPPMLNPASCKSSALPGGVSDCFYSYETLDQADKASNANAWFGHKVLAVSYGGTLQLFGKKGAIYPGTITPCSESDPSCTGTSWARLQGTLTPGMQTLVVDRAVDWQDGDHIVVTTTDYLPGHSEELIISGTPTVNGNTTTINFINADPTATGVKWPHNGQMFELSESVYPGISRLGLNISSADTRAAVGLLTRSIRIVSEGDTPTTPFPAPPTDGSTGYFFGGHTIVRQGFASYQVQGVMFYQLGQGGDIMHYPVHFHMDRQTPPAVNGVPPTFVKDSSIWDSMTRWIVIHGTQGIRLARNVGYKSIGHGYYLEDGTETGNQLYANLGVFARAAVANVQNPRRVPGILTANDTNCKNQDQSCAVGYDNFPYYSDANHPAVFWIMNGWNDFEYNMAAGAGTCGACYWFVPGAISGPSQTEKWFGYAGEQQGAGRAGTTPLQKFVGNTCSTAMEAFMEVGDSAACNGVNFMNPSNLTSKTSTLQMLPSAQASENFPVSDSNPNPLYWPIIGGGGRLATRCPAADQGNASADCSQAAICSDGNPANCDVVVLDQFTTSFNWPQNNFSAIWVRPFWSLVIDSVISDVQSAGLNFVTSGDFSKSSVITGFWALARKTVFIGSTQWQNVRSALSDNPLASNAGPFNPFVSQKLGGLKGLSCAPTINGQPNNQYCLDQNEGVSIQLTNFDISQRLFSVYDGPTYQDSNAFINIHPTFLTADGTENGAVIDDHGKCEPNENNGNPCQFSGFMNAGLAGIRAYRTGVADQARCYEPNAAIGWKQPNGFYYAPAFHSVNLYFNGVDIRHFVTEPLFEPGLFSFKTNLAETKQDYCTWNDQYFTGFTDIDRETVLNDDDGTLTGLTSPVGPSTKNETISVNKEDFFDAPTETTECASDVASNKDHNAKCPPATAKTSPYEYVTAVVYPECALSVPDSPALVRFCADQNWGSNCGNSPPADGGCLGIPIFRQYLVDGEVPGLRQMKRMMGQNTFQRSALTANHGIYYIDTTVSKQTQQNNGAQSPNVFAPGGVYDLFFVYAKPDTVQTYKLFVGKNIPDSGGKSFGDTNVKFGYVDISTAKYRFSAANGGALPSGWSSNYDPQSGILTLIANMSGIKSAFDLNSIVPNSKPPVTLGQTLCQPATMCSWVTNAGAGSCQCNPNSPYYNLCNQKNPAGQTVCSWSVKDLDCPAQGCPSFQITFPSSQYFAADDSDQRPRPQSFDFQPIGPTGFDWNVNFNLENSDIAGAQCTYTEQPPLRECMRGFGAPPRLGAPSPHRHRLLKRARLSLGPQRAWLDTAR
jgi:hypothetical protein